MVLVQSLIPAFFTVFVDVIFQVEVGLLIKCM